MRLLITGLNGTLAPHLARVAKAAGAQVLPWPRAVVDPADEAASALFLQRMKPDAIAHLGMGAEAWAGRLSAYAAIHHLPLLFTSSAMVFDHEPDGPHGKSSPRNAQDEYGRYKIRCEEAIWQVNTAACVARIGWQIDGSGQGNNMLAALDGWQQSEGKVAASRLWTPACSFMEDTAQALWQLLGERAKGLYHLDSNSAEAWRFDELVLALKAHFARDWQVEVTESYRHDQRLLGDEARMPPLSQRLTRP